MNILDEEIEIYSDSNPEEEDWELFIGDGREYYLPIWRKFQRQDQKIHFHFPALIANIYWLCYRKMYRTVIIYYAVSIIISAILTSQGVIQYAQAFVLMACLYSFFGLTGNWLYYQHAQNKIQEIKQKYPDKKVQRRELREAGGTNWGGIFIMLIAGSFLSTVITLLLKLLF